VEVFITFGWMRGLQLTVQPFGRKPNTFIRFKRRFFWN